MEKYWMTLYPGELYFDNIDNAILENNLFGVDINEDSTEIARLSLIMPNKWMLVDYGKELRRFLSHTALRQIINFGDVQFFKDA
ncbi:MAG: hypothetical protein IJR93_09185, partial [Treponema sp.]|nr:hypothetical protein [Treponema sp.]